MKTRYSRLRFLLWAIYLSAAVLYVAPNIYSSDWMHPEACLQSIQRTRDGIPIATAFPLCCQIFHAFPCQVMAIACGLIAPVFFAFCGHYTFAWMWLGLGFLGVVLLFIAFGALSFVLMPRTLITALLLVLSSLTSMSMLMKDERNLQRLDDPLRAIHRIIHHSSPSRKRTSQEDDLEFGIYLTLLSLGVWAMSCCILLDWQRIWLLWPVPNVYGILGAHLLYPLVSVVRQLAAQMFFSKALMSKY